MSKQIESVIKPLLGVHPDWPSKGIVFLDIFPIFRNPMHVELLITAFLNHVLTETLPRLSLPKVDVVVGLDARGFLLGPILALRLGAAFVPVRKRGKLPGQCQSAEYKKEYGVDTFEMQEGAIKPGQNVIVVDDLIATGGSASAAGQLVEKCQAKVIEYLFIINLTFLKGTEKLNAPSFSLVEDDG